MDVQIADLLAQCIAIDAQQFSRLYLVALGGGESGTDERLFQFAQEAQGGFVEGHANRIVDRRYT